MNLLIDIEYEQTNSNPKTAHTSDPLSARSGGSHPAGKRRETEVG